MQQQILTILFEQDEVTWREVLMNLVKTNQIDPWDVDIRLLTKEYLKLIRKLKALDFRVSGKVILAAALLLRIKSERLLEEDIMNFDSLMQSVDEAEIDDFYDSMEEQYNVTTEDDDIPKLIPRTPQMKKRRVSIYDLIEALEVVLEQPVQRRVFVRDTKAQITLPDIKVDIGKLIDTMSASLNKMFKKKKQIAFTDLVRGNTKEDRVYTIIPLLHLANIEHRAIDLSQEKNFAEIYVRPAVND
ncbi:MAG: segregation/condensation protein A [Candidatus Woesearchaeota archaeon]